MKTIQETKELNLSEPLKDSEPMVQRNEKGQLLPGSVLNPDGYTKGVRNFQTDFDEVVEEIAKANNITFSEARKILLRTAYKEAKDGKFPYSKDIFDRYYGKAKENLDITSGGKPIPLLFNLKDVPNHDSNQEDSDLTE